ncbi:MAG: hypothetical protein QOE90_563 [Thermoplasmata archaeon]|jgi:hypothetical protein|nr:hypothetical protein [Thermoplasmata archaeon]
MPATSQSQEFGFESLLRGASDLLRAYPLLLAGPLVLLGILAAGPGGVYAVSARPWWSLGFAALAFLAGLIALALAALQIGLWFVTFEASRRALATGRAPDLASAWASVKWHFGGGRLGASFGKAWALAEDHLGALLVAILVLVVAEWLASAVLHFIPLVGFALAGIVGGVFAAATAALMAVYYHRKGAPA